MRGWRGAEPLLGSAPAGNTWMSGRCMATERPSTFWRGTAAVVRMGQFLPGKRMHTMSTQPATTEEQSLEQSIAELGPWFQNLRLRGIQTAPEHFLGDYPEVKFARFRDAIPARSEERRVGKECRSR